MRNISFYISSSIFNHLGVVVFRYKSSEGPNNDFPILSPPEGWQFEGNW